MLSLVWCCIRVRATPAGPARPFHLRICSGAGSGAMPPPAPGWRRCRGDRGERGQERRRGSERGEGRERPGEMEPLLPLSPDRSQPRSGRCAPQLPAGALQLRFPWSPVRCSAVVKGQPGLGTGVPAGGTPCSAGQGQPSPGTPFSRDSPFQCSQPFPCAPSASAAAARGGFGRSLLVMGGWKCWSLSVRPPSFERCAGGTPVLQGLCFSECRCSNNQKG